jgi:pyruvate/2-oxoglutarate dehydrogenase complex dihydrolipoamide acyltransferase (E2) component
MDDKIGPYQVVELAPGRRIWVNTLELSWPSHAIYALLEVDVTGPRQLMAEHKERAGETLSFTGFLAYCLARAIEEDKSMQAWLKGRGQLVMFDDVSIGLMVEHEAGGKRGLMGHVVWGANRKTYRQIHDEIRAVQSAPLPENRGMPSWFRSAMLLPWPLSRMFMVWLRWSGRRNPTTLVSMSGTVAITSIGLFGRGHGGWGLTPTPQPLGLVIGGVAWKPAVIEGRVVPREILHLTVMFNHDIVDGAPAARFTHRLVDLIESGCGLDETVAR